MTGFIQSLKEKVHSLDPAYRREREFRQKEMIQAEKEMIQAVREIGLITTAASVGSVVFTVLGMASSANSIILVTLPLGFFSLNIYQVSKNFRDILENPDKYPFTSIDQDLINMRSKLEQGTICFSWIIDSVLEQIKLKK